MWVRKRLDIGWPDLLYGFASCCFRRSKAEKRLDDLWSHLDGAFACHSVRTALDLLLTVLKLPAGSEVLISAITVKGMIEVIEAHGLVAVPLDIAPGSLVPPLQILEQAMTPRSKVLVVAQLFGNRYELDELWRTARVHGLITVEDNAQGFRGIPEKVAGCDLSFYSFGPIKVATALGGAMVTGENLPLIARMRALESTFPVVTRWSCCKRLARIAAVKIMVLKSCFGMYLFVLSLLGRDGDAVLSRRLRGFRPGALMPQLRYRPATPVISLLARRHARFDRQEQATMVRRGERFRVQVAPCVTVSGGDCQDRGYWILAVEATSSAGIVKTLRSQGFDACQKGSLTVVEAPASRRDLSVHNAERLLREAVFLPFYRQMPSDEQDRMAGLIRSMVDQNAPANTVRSPESRDS